MPPRSRSPRFRVALALVMTFATMGPAFAATIQVPSATAPDIQTAFTSADTGDVIVIKRGTYAETPVLDGKDGIEIRGKGKVVIDASGLGTGLTISNSTNIDVSKIRVEDAAGIGIYVLSSTDVVIEKCRVTGGASDGIRVDDSRRVTVQKNRVEGVGRDAITLGGDHEVREGRIPSHDCIVTRNTVKAPQDDGIEIAGDDNMISRNKVLDPASVALNTDAENPSQRATFERNVCLRSGDQAILVEGSAHSFFSNKVKGTLGDGIVLLGTGGHTIRGNRFQKIEGTGSDGIDVEVGSDANVIDGNKVSKVNEDGLVVRSNGNSVTANKITKAGNDGVDVSGTGNTFTLNKTKKSGGKELDDTAGDGANTYTGDNKFGSERL